MSKPFVHRPYGGPAMRHMLEHDRSNLFAVPGCGKTGIALSVIDARMLMGFDKPTLILAPKRVAADTWTTEAAKWDEFKHIEIAPIIGDERTRRRQLRRDVPAHSINYENIEWLMQECKDYWPFGAVIADESTKLKSARTRQGGKRARAIMPVAHRNVKFWNNLTGTPSSNGLKDLWGQQWFIDAGRRLGKSYSDFTSRWFKKGYDGFSFDPMPFAQQQIMDAIADCTMSIRAEDWFDLEKPIVTNVPVELPPLARKHYRELEKEMFTRLESAHGIEALNAAALTMKANQCASGAFYVDEGKAWKVVHDEKIAALESIIEELGEAVMVSYIFKSDRARLLAAFKGRAVDLSTPDGMAAFRAGKAPIGLAHPQSLGHGVDGLQYVTRAIVHFSSDWNLETYLQINDRIGPVRQYQAGLKRAALVYHIIAKNTVDEVIAARRESKREVQDVLMEYMRLRR